MDSHHHQEGSHDCGQSCDSLKILESCALPGQFTTRLVTKSEASHTGITLYAKQPLRPRYSSVSCPLGPLMGMRVPSMQPMHPGMPAMVEKACMIASSSAGVGNLMCLAETSVMARTTLLMQRDALACDISAVSATVSWKLPVAR